MLICLLHLFTVADALFLLILYGSHLAKSDQHTTLRKAVWGVCMFFWGVIALPLYWHRHIAPILREYPAASSVESISGDTAG